MVRATLSQLQAIQSPVVLGRAENALHVVLRLGERNVVDELVTGLASTDAWEMEASANVLGWLGPAAARAVPALIRYAQPLGASSTGDDDIRWQAAVRALDRIQGRPAGAEPVD